MALLLKGSKPTITIISIENVMLISTQLQVSFDHIQLAVIVDSVTLFAKHGNHCPSAAMMKPVSKRRQKPSSNSKKKMRVNSIKIAYAYTFIHAPLLSFTKQPNRLYGYGIIMKIQERKTMQPFRCDRIYVCIYFTLGFFVVVVVSLFRLPNYIVNHRHCMRNQYALCILIRWLLEIVWWIFFSIYDVEIQWRPHLFMV